MTRAAVIVLEMEPMRYCMRGLGGTPPLRHPAAHSRPGHGTLAQHRRYQRRHPRLGLCLRHVGREVPGGGREYGGARGYGAHRGYSAKASIGGHVHIRCRSP
jgi:hypothetical protein